jgi:HTH-type transcriptional regulator / antitoxin HigA
MTKSMHSQSEMPPRLIKTEAEHEAALARIEKLMGAQKGTPQGDEFELRVRLVELYEEERYPIDAPTPVAAIKFRMDQAGLSQQDLVPLIGSRGRVSEILSGKRPLSLRMIRALHEKLGIPAESLIADPNLAASLLAEDATEWSRFPVKEMAKRGWFGRLNPADAQDLAEENLRPLLQPFGALLGGLLRQRVRAGSNVDEYALRAWVARVLGLAAGCNVRATEEWRVDGKLVQQLLAFSQLETGPVLAQEFLAQNGIAMVVLRHLPRTHLDGAALAPATGPPVVALTLRHDRLDNFWFTLCHELAHLARHLHSDGGVFIDDLDASAEDAIEKEADSQATDWLIPPKDWMSSGLQVAPTTANVLELAAVLRVSPTIVAGRVRREQKNYRMLSRMVGSRQVRRLFDNIDSGWPGVGAS